ncbi:hypothetical protein ASPWEDRAFT_30474 [Aspergillus wentii DTO 134E9]|uniref:Uncharacterized protein n=1 Tax=Aspergillus wentii DTO 134E9 TaxID=1073089 RepID=A0A1L9REP5_ASPWE|nr:uncharacterized protein ASPWEDRAFT_30474 [Aspergillus wentii DTO 134E9]OJJ33396.1 hypothetical protein ASPWEDRAFT_30474 [Aspergillus wentii DTO 134E9]
MRLSVRVGLAGLLILAIVLVKRNLDLMRDDSRVQPFWQINFSNSAGGGAGSAQQLSSPPTTKQEGVVPDGFKIGTPINSDDNVFDHSKQPKLAGTPLKTETGSDQDEIQVENQTWETTPITVPVDGAIVMARLSSEDTQWVADELAHWRRIIYTVDDLSASMHTPTNKGRESLAYLQYIVDHYSDLPETIVFIHSHKDGLPAGWHTDTIEYSNIESVRSLRLDYVQQNGYANLRCQDAPGCPAEIHPSLKSSSSKASTSTDSVYAQAWVELFNNTEVPEVVGVPCCSQFAVSRDQVLKRPLSDYQHYYEWVLTTDLSDEVAAHIMEYTWHIIFGQNPV